MKKKLRIKRWRMLGGSSTWIKPETLKNIDRIYSFLLKKTNLDAKKKPRFSYFQISEEINVNRKSVQFAIQKLAFCDPPIVKIHAVKYPMNGSVKISEKTELVRTI